MTCSACGAEVEAQDASCPRCGTLLGEAKTDAGPVLTAPEGPGPAPFELGPGTVCHGRYEILGLIGRGGMGMVYRARDRTLDEVVAIKVLRPDHWHDPHMAERFKSEIKLARKVRHRNVCSIHDYGEDRGLLYISMELVEGTDLKHLLKRGGGLPPEQGFDVAIQVAEGLEAVHEAGIVHRDLKTPNIMLDTGGRARLMDFGVAKRMGEGTITAAGHIIGTPEYMSPEQAQGHKVDFRSDIYALGVVVFEIFTGHVPFQGETPISTLLKHINESPPVEGPLARGLPQPLRPVLRRALGKEPAQRYGSAREMADALRAARARAGPSAPVEPRAPAEPVAPTERHARVPPPPRAVRRRPSDRPRHAMLQPWLLIVPFVAVGGAALVLSGRSRGREDSSAAMHAPPDSVAAASPGPALAFEPTATLAAASPGEAPAAPASTTPGPVSTAVQTPKPRPEAAARQPLRTTPLPAAAVASPPRSGPVPDPAPTPAPSQPTRRAASPAVPSPPEVVATSPGVVETGQLQIAVIPWARVWVDEKDMGDTPFPRITLAAGVHRVRARNPAWEVWEQQVVVRPGEMEKLVIDLRAHGIPKRR